MTRLRLRCGRSAGGRGRLACHGARARLTSASAYSGIRAETMPTDEVYVKKVFPKSAEVRAVVRSVWGCESVGGRRWLRARGAFVSVAACVRMRACFVSLRCVFLRGGPLRTCGTPAAQAREIIKAALAKNILFASLREEEMEEVVDACRQQPVTSGAREWGGRGRGRGVVS